VHAILPAPTAEVPTRPPAARPAPTPPVRPERRAPGRVLRSEYLRVASLSPGQRSDLSARLYAIYDETVRGVTQLELDTMIFGTDEGSLALFYGAHDELVGFSFASIARVQHEGRTFAVFVAGVLFRLGCRGGPTASLFGLRQALQFKLRHPRTPLAYFSRSSSPAAYRLVASTMPRVYPNHIEEPSDQIVAVVRAASAQLKYVPTGDCPWVVRSGATPRDTSRLRLLKEDPYTRFYLELNPRYAEGEALMVWIPLDAANIAGGLFRLLCARLKR
jgi:hypothetical protein